jgi:hypothetical protein
MPRDGTQTYYLPAGTPGVPNYPIESTKYNTFIADVERDLNDARPIVAGGTGATNADAALAALGGEKAKQGPVTNFDNFPFVNGSWTSNAGATSAPNGTDAFVGTYYESSNPAYATLVAYDLFNVNSLSFVRRKNNGVWEGWVKQEYVPITGGVVTGDLTVSSALYFGGPTHSLSWTGTHFQFSNDITVLQNVVAGTDVIALNDLTSSRNVNCGNIGYKPGGGSWVATISDARAKNVLGDYTSSLAEIIAINPVRYTFKGNDTNTAPTGEAPYSNSPHAYPAKEATEFIGLIAQDAEQAMPELVTQTSGYINGVAVSDMRQLDQTPLVFALINAVKELNARIEALEAQR